MDSEILYNAAGYDNVFHVKDPSLRLSCPKCGGDKFHLYAGYINTDAIFQIEIRCPKCGLVTDKWEKIKQ